MSSVWRIPVIIDQVSIIADLVLGLDKDPDLAAIVLGKWILILTGSASEFVRTL